MICDRKIGRFDCCSVVQGDCLSLMREIPDGAVDAVITSPPYNLGNTTGGGFVKQLGGMAYQRTHYAEDVPLGKRGGVGKWSGGALAYGYGSFNDALPHDEYVAQQNERLRELWRLLSETGAIFYNHKPRVLGGRVILPLDYLPAELRQFLRQEVIWARAGGMNFSPSFYCPTHERVLIVARPDFRLRDKGASGAGDVWYIPQEPCDEHPAPFPEALPITILETVDAQTVLDPHVGRGTTLVAAKKLGRHFLGFEISEAYCEIARRRLAEIDAQPSLFAPKAEQMTL